MLEVQDRIMAVESAQELPDLIAHHCARTPFQYPPCMTPVDLCPVQDSHGDTRGRPRGDFFTQAAEFSGGRLGALSMATVTDFNPPGL